MKVEIRGEKLWKVEIRGILIAVVDPRGGGGQVGPDPPPPPLSGKYNVLVNKE